MLDSKFILNSFTIYNSTLCYTINKIQSTGYLRVGNIYIRLNIVIVMFKKIYWIYKYGQMVIVIVKNYWIYKYG